MSPEPQTRRRILVAAAGALALAPPAALVMAAPKERVIEVIAKKFQFVPEEIKLR
jgi:cytochrome c oxidase subunit II